LLAKIPGLEDSHRNLPDVTVQCISLNRQRFVLAFRFVMFLTAVGMVVGCLHAVIYRDGRDLREPQRTKFLRVKWSRSIPRMDKNSESVVSEFEIDEPVNFSEDSSDLSDLLVEPITNKL
jgi:hypothetical protein